MASAGFFAAAAALWAAAMSGTAARAACVRVPLNLSGPRPSVEIRVGGAAPVQAILDTGALNTVVDISEAERLGLPNRGPLPAGFNSVGVTQGFTTTLPSLAVGEISLGPVSAIAVRTPLPGIAAILSPNAFGDRLLTFNFAAHALDVCERGGDDIPEGAGNPHGSGPLALPSAQLTVVGRAMSALIDTGSPMALAFPLRYSEQIPLAGPMVRAGTARSHSGEHAIYRAQVNGAVQLGPLRLESPEIRFTDAAPEPLIGMPLLRQLRLTVDPRERRTWLRAGEPSQGAGDQSGRAQLRPGSRH